MKITKIDKDADRLFEEKIRNDKEEITIESIRKSKRFMKYVAIPIFILWGIFLVFFITFMFKAISEDDADSLLAIGGWLIGTIMLSAVALLFLKQIKKEKNESKMLEEGNFRIVEDEIYDRNVYTTTDSDGHSTDHYELFTKIYGRVNSDFRGYMAARKGEKAYLLFYNGDERDNIFFSIKEENERNSKNVDEIFVAANSVLATELQLKLTIYDTSLGERNFNQRIGEAIKNLQSNGKKIRCKKCEKKYKVKQYEYCPYCGTINLFDKIDIMHEKSWYNYS